MIYYGTYATYRTYDVRARLLPRSPQLVLACFIELIHSGPPVPTNSALFPMSTNPSPGSVQEIKKPIRLFIVEDHFSLREMLCMYCKMQEDIDLCGFAASGEEALETLPDCLPDVVLVDLALPGMSGIEFIVEARRRHPDLVCLILSGHKEQDFGRQALEAGAQGYLLKGRPDTIGETIRRAAAGELCFSEAIQME